MTTLNYDTATLDELQAEFVRLAGVVVTASNDRQAILGLINKRSVALERVKKLAPEERVDLRKALDAVALTEAVLK